MLLQVNNKHKHKHTNKHTDKLTHTHRKRIQFKTTTQKTIPFPFFGIIAVAFVYWGRNKFVFNSKSILFDKNGMA